MGWINHQYKHKHTHTHTRTHAHTHTSAHTISACARYPPPLLSSPTQAGHICIRAHGDAKVMFITAKCGPKESTPVQPHTQSGHLPCSGVRVTASKIGEQASIDRGVREESDEDSSKPPMPSCDVTRDSVDVESALSMLSSTTMASGCLGLNALPDIARFRDRGQEQPG